jgi:hypothetical protein
MQVYLYSRDVEGHEKLYFSTIQTGDENLAVLNVESSKVNIIEALNCFPYAYPKKPLHRNSEKSLEQKQKEAAEHDAECAKLREELSGFLEA